MTKKILLILAAMLFFSDFADARINAPEDFTLTRSYNVSRRLMRDFGTEREGVMSMSFEEFISRPVTRNDRRNMRRDQRDGVFLPDRERFDLIDANGDGYVDREELGRHIRNLRDQGRLFY